MKTSINLKKLKLLSRSNLNDTKSVFNLKMLILMIHENYKFAGDAFPSKSFFFRGNFQFTIDTIYRKKMESHIKDSGIQNVTTQSSNAPQK